MSQLILLLVVVAIAWLGYRKFIADAQRLSRKRREAEKERQTGAVGTLVKDPETGEYRLRRDDDE
jgi:membrane protein implicated in regulation of membrane protease activity